LAVKNKKKTHKGKVALSVAWGGGGGKDQTAEVRESRSTEEGQIRGLCRLFSGRLAIAKYEQRAGEDGVLNRYFKKGIGAQEKT